MRATWLTGGSFLVVATGTAVLLSITAAAPADGKSSVGLPPPVTLKPSKPLTGVAFAGTPAVGALFTTSAGRLGEHFCTATVVDSRAGDLLVTAAHCVSGYPAAKPAGLAFVPDYAGRTRPYGIWKVTRIVVDSAWASAGDPDDDVAFLMVAPHQGDVQIENVTGAENLSTGRRPAGVIRVIGYPDALSRPIRCQNQVTAFSSRQLEFSCGSYTNGTSGGPFITDVDPFTGDGTVIGVIGGYEQGGLSPDVSYAAAFGRNVQSLYDVALGRH
jgi:V8-like Glu-specific endopeptidase